MKNRKVLFTILGAIILTVISYFVFSTIYSNTKQVLFIEINNAIIGIIFGGIVTVLLLSQQTSNEEVKERNVELFKVKHEMYNKFFDVLWSAWDDNNLDDKEVKEVLRYLKRISLFLDDKSTIKLSRSIHDLLKVNYSDNENKTQEIEMIFIQITLLLRQDLGIKTSKNSEAEYKKIMEADEDISKLVKAQSSKVLHKGLLKNNGENNA